MIEWLSPGRGGTAAVGVQGIPVMGQRWESEALSQFWIVLPSLTLEGSVKGFFCREYI